MIASKSPTAVIAGAGGTVGTFLAAALLNGGWTVIGLARRPVKIPGMDWIGVDLLSESDCREKLRGLTQTTHLFCAARYDFSEGGREPIAENVAIVGNLVKSLDAIAPALRHVHLVQGSKYYGSHVGSYTTPAREDQPRSLVPNFYYDQQDFVTNMQRDARWTWSVSRPDAIIHATPGIPRNLVSAIAAYALICRELALPFSFPGGTEAADALYQCTSADHLAAGLLWIAEASVARNQAYNMVNGDYFRWVNLWPAFARYFNVELGPVRQFRLAEAMSDKALVWDALCRRRGLDPIPFDQVANWDYADYILSRKWDVMSDMTKARMHGFHRSVSTEAEFLRFFDELKIKNVTPST
jgi:nucleoside-diphosphate-sugar epimerase